MNIFASIVKVILFIIIVVIVIMIPWPVCFRWHRRQQTSCPNVASPARSEVSSTSKERDKWQCFSSPTTPNWIPRAWQQWNTLPQTATCYQIVASNNDAIYYLASSLLIMYYLSRSIYYVLCSICGCGFNHDNTITTITQTETSLTTMDISIYTTLL